MMNKIREPYSVWKMVAIYAGFLKRKYTILLPRLCALMCLYVIFSIANRYMKVSSVVIMLALSFVLSFVGNFAFLFYLYLFSVDVLISVEKPYIGIREVFLRLVIFSALVSVVRDVLVTLVFHYTHNAQSQYGFFAVLMTYIIFYWMSLGVIMMAAGCKLPETIKQSATFLADHIKKMIGFLIVAIVFYFVSVIAFLLAFSLVAYSIQAKGIFLPFLGHLIPAITFPVVLFVYAKLAYFKDPPVYKI